MSTLHAARVCISNRQNFYLIIIIIIRVVLHKVFVSNLFLANNITVKCTDQNQALFHKHSNN